MAEQEYTPLDARLNETLLLGEELWALTDGLEVPHNTELKLIRLYNEAAGIFRHALRIAKESSSGSDNATTTAPHPARPQRRG